MNTSYHSLPHELLASGASISQSQHAEIDTITLTDKAELVLTDFAYTRPFTISTTATIDQINDKMIACGVRLLFVARTDGVLHGLVTFTDLFGEKPVQYIKEHGGSREEILAQDIMTPLTQLEALRQEKVKRAKVGDIVQTIKAAGRQHMLVCHSYKEGSQVVTGLFSSTHIEKLLDIKIELSPRAQTFADLERALI
jgi:CBS-domain-containing membrane protein